MDVTNLKTEKTENKVYEFCLNFVDAETTPKYVKKQMLEFIELCEGKNKKYKISEAKLSQLENILKLLIYSESNLAALKVKKDCLNYNSVCR